MNHKVIIVSGVSGSGKTTVGKTLAKELKLDFFDGDQFHPVSNIEKMTSGLPLDDTDRYPWLIEINSFIKKCLPNKSIIVACSALKSEYRNKLSEGLHSSNIIWVHLSGDFTTIYNRMKLRTGHFMSAEMLQSQFDAYEKPVDGIIINVNQNLNEIMENIMAAIGLKKSHIGLIGLGVMGTSLARNISNKGYQISLYNRNVSGTEEDVALHAVQNFSELNDALPFDNLSLFIDSLQSPRKIILMVSAGKAVDEVIEQIKCLLDKGDVIVDGGNSHFKDTSEREKQLEALGIHFVGSGISGGEEGALLGPSIMPGGSKAGYDLVKEIFYDIAARNLQQEICCDYIGEGGAGHFVKMVHNGIEYAEMQLIAEMYSHLRYDQNKTLDEIILLFEIWLMSDVGSYLLEITCDILKFKDDDRLPLIDKISDKAANKGTGSWTTITACEIGVPTPLISSALFARYLSAFKDDRLKYHKVYTTDLTQIDIDEGDLQNAYFFGKILNHYQGVHLIQKASELYKWNIDIEALFKTWSGGCIIRSSLLALLKEDIKKCNNDVLMVPFIVSFIQENIQKIKETISQLVLSDLSYPTLSSSLDYFKYLTTAESNANLIQAQRDYFGSHTYLRTDDPSGKSHHTNWN